MDNNKTYLSQPLQIMVDIQLGPDGHPWIRVQLATVGMTTSFVFPVESAEEVVSNLTDRVRRAVKDAFRKQSDIVMPDFTGIAVSQ
jgi:hypothetical protein